MALGLSFHPPLSRTTTVAVPPAAADTDVELAFTAKFPSADACARARREGLRVELWTDLQAAGRGPGQWGELPFVFPEVDDAGAGAGAAAFQAAAAEAAGLIPFALTPEARDCLTGTAAPSPADTLHLKVFARIPPGAARFSYTYRLVYPSGEVKWLGEYSRDGVLAVERRDPRIELGQRWVQKKSGSYSWDRQGQVEVELARLNAKLRWSCWVVNQAGDAQFYPSLAETPEKISPAVVVLIPETPKEWLSILEPLVFSASATSSLSLATNGTITVTPVDDTFPTFHLHTHDSNWDLRTFVQDVFLSLPAGVAARIASVHPEAGFAIFASPASTVPVVFSAVPFSFVGAPSASFPVPVYELAALVPANPDDLPSAGLTAFAPAGAQTLFLPSGPGEDDSVAIQGVLLAPSRSGGAFVLAPTYALGGGSQVDVALLTPHALAPPAASEAELAAQLPSPPLTPPRAISPEPVPSIAQALEPSESAVTFPSASETLASLESASERLKESESTATNGTVDVHVSTELEKQSAAVGSGDVTISLAPAAVAPEVPRPRPQTRARTSSFLFFPPSPSALLTRARSATHDSLQLARAVAARQLPPALLRARSPSGTPLPPFSFALARVWLKYALVHFFRMSALVVGMLFARVFGGLAATRVGPGSGAGRLPGQGAGSVNGVGIRAASITGTAHRPRNGRGWGSTDTLSSDRGSVPSTPRPASPLLAGLRTPPLLAVDEVASPAAFVEEPAPISITDEATLAQSPAAAVPAPIDTAPAADASSDSPPLTPSGSEQTLVGHGASSAAAPPAKAPALAFDVPAGAVRLLVQTLAKGGAGLEHVRVAVDGAERVAVVLDQGGGVGAARVLDVGVVHEPARVEVSFVL